MYWKKYWGSFVSPPICFHVSVHQSLSNVCTCPLRVRLWIKVNKILCRFQGLSLTSDMKPAHHTLFRDQVSTLVEWFANWNDCEQTIALYTLLKRISTIQAKFLSLILEHTFRDDSFEVQMMQRRANDKGSIYFDWCTWAGYSGPLLFITVGNCETDWPCKIPKVTKSFFLLIQARRISPFVIDTHLWNCYFSFLISSLNQIYKHCFSISLLDASHCNASVCKL